jgi:hypothetical protein
LHGSTTSARGLEVIAELEPGTDPYRKAGAAWLLAAPDGNDEEALP